jgi:hypothetical protein
MRFNDMLLKILEFIRDNYDNLFKTNDDKAIISSSIEFLEKDKEFLSLIKSNNIEDVKRLETLSKELRKINDDFELYKKINHVNSTNGVGLISNIIVRNFDAIFKDKENKIAINKKLNDIFFVPEYDYVGLFNLLFQNENLSDSFKLKIFLNISYLLKEVYMENNEINNLKKIDDINNSLKDVSKNDMFKIRKKSSSMFDLFEPQNQKDDKENINLFSMLFDYNEYENKKIIGDVEHAKMLKEIVSSDGPFNGLSFDYIAKVLYSFIVLNNRAFDIMSDKDGYAFKDLSPISDIIKRRTYDGENADNVILNLASGKTLITFNEQTSNDKERKEM